MKDLKKNFGCERELDVAQENRNNQVSRIAWMAPCLQKLV